MSRATVQEHIERMNQAQRDIARIRAEHGVESAQSLMEHLANCQCEATPVGRPT